MIDVLMLDLGGTLVDSVNRMPLPHVRETLTALGEAPGAPKTCLVSDYHMNVSISSAMQAYKQILERAGLLRFFEPIEERVTLSNHAGKSKPNRKVFEMALERLGMAEKPLSRCALVTEDAAHVRYVRHELHMQAFLFGTDFTDWAEFPKLLGLALTAPSRKWHIISVPGFSDLSEVEVEMSSSPDEAEEVRSFIAGLAARKQIAGVAGAGELRTTHELIEGPNGYPRLVRRRFTQH